MVNHFATIKATDVAESALVADLSNVASSAFLCNLSLTYRSLDLREALPVELIEDFSPPRFAV